MANRYAVATGNWSNVATWDGGTTLPQAGDTVRPNTYTVTIDQDVTVTELRNDAGGGASAGGSFLVSSGGKTITAALSPKVASVSLVVFSANSPNQLTVVGNIDGSTVTVSSCIGLNVTGTGTVNVTGNVIGGGAAAGSSGSHGINNNTSGTVNITGDVTAGRGVANHGVNNASTGTVNVVGHVTGGPTPSNNDCNGIRNASTGSVVVTGNVYGGASTASHGIYGASTGPVTVIGDLYPSADGCACLFVAMAKLTIYGDLVSHASGRHAFATCAILIHATDPAQHEYRVNNSGAVGVARSLYTGGQNLGQPDEADVRYGTTYGVSNEYTGEIRVPPAGSVAFGVLVDNTSGTATLSHPGVLQQTTIATLASQTSFTLTAGSADDDAYNGMTIVVTDASTSTQKCVGTISTYTGATKTVTLSADPGIFTMAVGDSVAIIAGGGEMRSIAGSVTAATRLKHMANATISGTVAADGSNSSSTFKTDLTETATDYFGGTLGGCVLVFVSGANNAVQARRISAYNGTSKFVTVESAFDETPTDGDTFVILGRIEI